jgi:hypothetical protein
MAVDAGSLEVDFGGKGSEPLLPRGGDTPYFFAIAAVQWVISSAVIIPRGFSRASS